MPELPEVETVARDLRPLVVGATIAGARVTWPPTLRNVDPAAFGPAVTGRSIEGVGRRGKQLVLDLSGGLALTIHLKMTGQLFLVPAAMPEDPYVRAAIAFADGRELRFRDIRKFGRIGVYERDSTTGELRDATGALTFAGHGPEPLADAFTLRRFRERLRARRGRLKPLITDQAFLAGVGNIYADEALWRARLHPLRTAGTLRPPDEARLYRAIRSVLAEAIEHRGSSVDDYTAPNGDGEMQERLDVYQRTGLPCPRCGRPLRRIVIGARGTHLCSWCQRLPATDRAGAAAILRAGAPGRHGPVPARGRRRAASAPSPAAAATARTSATRKAAATRRAAARTGAGTGPEAGREEVLAQASAQRQGPDTLRETGRDEPSANAPAAPPTPRRGPRWTELPAGEGAVGLRAGEGGGRRDPAPANDASSTRRSTP